MTFAPRRPAHVILSRERSETAKDLKSRISRSFGVFAPQPSEVVSQAAMRSTRADPRRRKA